MKTCYICDKEIREEQKICYDCYKEVKNLKEIPANEIVLDCDHREFGDITLRRMGMILSVEGYRLEIYKAEGQKSYHIHIKNIPHIEELPKKQNKLYKELFLKKYMKRITEILGYEPEGLEKMDFTLCVPNHLVAEEYKTHFKYKTEKKLIVVINEENRNFCEIELYNLATQEKEEYKPQVEGSGITAKIIEKISIVDIAKQFGLSIQGNKTLCPFHPDNNTPSLVFYESQGRYICFGCNKKGNIIDFYSKLKGLKPKFKYEMVKENDL